MLAAVAALILTALFFVPAPYYAPYLDLIDQDDSVHPLSPAQLAAVRLAIGLSAGGFALSACLLWAGRRPVAVGLEQVRANTVIVLGELRLPRTLSFGLILLAALALRVVLLDGPIWFDEADTFNYYASRSYFNTLSDYTAPNNHILHTLLLRSSYLLFGVSLPALRLPALLAGMLVLPLTFLFARRLFGQPAAYWAMALAAIQPALVFYSTNARGYTLLCVWTLLVFLALSFLREERNRFAWLVFVAAGIAGMFTIPIMLYPLSAASLWALWSAKARRRPRLVLEVAAAAVAIGGGAALLYAPAAARTGVDAIVANRYVASISWPEMASKLPAMFDNSWALWTDHLSWPVLLVAAVVTLAGLREREAWRLAVVLAATACLWMIVQRVIPYARVFVYAAPLICAIAGAGLRRLGAQPAWAPAVAAVLAIHYYAGYAWSPTADERTYRQVRAWGSRLLEEAGPSTAVVATIPLSEPIRYAFLTSGRSRKQVFEGTLATRTPHALDGWNEILVVRPIERHRARSFRIDLDHPNLAAFSAPETLLRQEPLEVYRMKRGAAKSDGR